MEEANIRMRNFITLEDLTLETIENLIKRTLEIKQTKQYPQLTDTYIANLFFENSTRTKCSFEVAERKTGMKVIPFEAQTSSVQKGETLYDTVKTLESVGVDAVVIRHQQEAYYKALQNINIPIINGGDGKGNHPSQSLLDLVTIWEQFGRFKDLRIVIVGDVLHSRVAHSNIHILQRFGAKVEVASPAIWQESNLPNVNFVKLDDVIGCVDIVMLLRIQHERHQDNFKTEDFLTEYGLTIARANKLKKDAIIIHPAPINRGVEIDSTLVESPKSRIFPQMENGMYARVAILEYVMEGNEK